MLWRSPKRDTNCPRILAIASGGGHWAQMRRLMPALEECEISFVSVYPDYADAIPGRRFYVVPDMTRYNVRVLFKLVPRLIGILLKERPDVVITTGSAPGLIGIALAKLVSRARTIWIDSIANVEQLSGSGRRARYFADVWLTQWPHLSKPEGPAYWGAVL